MITSETKDIINDETYNRFLYLMQARVTTLLEKPGTVVYTTDNDKLFEKYLGRIDESVRQIHNCNCCRRFVNTFGNLVTIGADGQLVPLMWDRTIAKGCPEIQEAVELMHFLTSTGDITGVFYSKSVNWGNHFEGGYFHMSCVVPEHMRFRHALNTPSQAMAEKVEEYKMVRRAISDYSTHTVERAIAVLETDHLYRSDKFLGIAQWFWSLKVECDNIQNRKLKTNLVWRAVGTAPKGFAHIRSSMIGTLLDDLEARVSFDDAKAKFNDKMHPLKYQRPQSAPSDANIEQAEKIIEKMGLQNALRRRYARLEELPTLWLPADKEEPTGSVFGHLKRKHDREVMTSSKITPITWLKFQRDVLPKVTRMEAYLDSNRMNLGAMVTAADMSAPHIIAWDREDKRNPVSIYLYYQGSAPAHWGIGKFFAEVTGVVSRPSMWGDAPFPGQIEGVMFALKGCKDQRYKSAGNALFPECLRSELHGIRKTIEAYSRGAVIEGQEESSACGLFFNKGSAMPIKLRVTTELMIETYQLDRWE